VSKVDFLEDETKKIWALLRKLEGESSALKLENEVLKEAVEQKTTDLEIEAKVAADKIIEYEAKNKETTESIASYLVEANSKLEEVRNITNTISQLQPQFIEYYNLSKANNESVKSIYESINDNKNLIQTKINELETIFLNNASYVDKIAKLEELYTKGAEYTTKIETSYTSVISRNEQIDKLYYSIVGYVGKDDKGAEVKVAGLKDKLSEIYNNLKLQAESIGQKLADIELNTELQYKTYREDKESEFNGTLANWKVDYAEISKKVYDLLPEALTKGLSAAYHEKKQKEIAESRILARNFAKAIKGMVIVSVIPFLISIVSLFNNKSLDQVMMDMPRLVLAILPLYVPVLWLAYSANKSIKLSKRLIEEYTHKEVLSKTFEGLSKQIENIEDKDISSELRVKLLYNILEVNSENPGKLITDYNKSDHPLMDALDKSVQLGIAVEKLVNIPGLSKLVPALEKKAKKILDKKKENAEDGLDVLSRKKKTKEEKDVEETEED
jgi:hypothetical protein